MSESHIRASQESASPRTASRQALAGSRVPITPTFRAQLAAQFPDRTSFDNDSGVGQRSIRKHMATTPDVSTSHVCGFSIEGNLAIATDARNHSPPSS